MANSFDSLDSRNIQVTSPFETIIVLRTELSKPPHSEHILSGDSHYGYGISQVDRAHQFIYHRIYGISGDLSAINCSLF